MFSLSSLRLAAPLAAALLLAGCGQSSEPAAATTASAPSAPVAATPEADLVNGRAAFVRVCAVCHQVTGQGVPGVFPPLVGSHLVTAADPGVAIRIVLHGLQGPIEVKGQTYNSAMPPQGPLLKDRDIADVLSYVRSSWGHSAPEVTEEQVKTVRRTVKRDTMWTWPELQKATAGH